MILNGSGKIERKRKLDEASAEEVEASERDRVLCC